ncbi:hypothetical protein [uncultured Ilyobacter sp.]|uniref:hypothetical protein n=1 Tax=uncultured Ilyobacter sp. TaxID=544433 RepID=UPI0029C8D73B|nr:hypothetical protein [uncultured Ilyobacter sp.]
MAEFTRSTTTPAADIKRIAPDMRIVLGAADATIATLQVLAQDNTDGKFYKYVDGDEAVGVIAGIYTGPEVTLTALGSDAAGTITSLAIVAKGDIVGVDFDTDTTAITQFKQCGIILTDKIEGTEEV